MLEKEPGILVAMPDGQAGCVEVWSSKQTALTEKTVKDLVELDADFEVTGFKRGVN